MIMRVSKESAEELAYGHMTGLDSEYYEIMSAELSSYFDEGVSNVNEYVVAFVDVNTVLISKLVYKIFDYIIDNWTDMFDGKEVIKNIELNLNLVLKPIVVYYIVYIMIYQIEKMKKLDFSSVDDYDIEDIFLASFGYSGLDIITLDYIQYHYKNYTGEELPYTGEEELRYLISNCIQENIDFFKEHLTSFIINNYHFFDIIKQIYKYTDNIIPVLVDFTIRNKVVVKEKIKEVVKNSPYELTSKGKEFNVEVTHIKLLLIGEMNEGR